MSESRQRRFNAAIMAVVYPCLGVLPGMFSLFYWFPGLPLLLFLISLYLGAKSLYDALDSAPEVRPAAIVLYLPVMVSFVVGFCMLLSLFLHWMWRW